MYVRMYRCIDVCMCVYIYIYIYHARHVLSCPGGGSVP